MSVTEKKESEMSFERLLLFTDAIVAIAITLLALDLRLEVPEDHELTFHDLLEPWRNYLAFALSFINIAGFWQNHHFIFNRVHKMDYRLMAFNTSWLFLIITLPFCTTLVSSHFDTTPAIFIYSMNILLVTIFQNLMWRYSATKEGFMDERDPYSKSGQRVNTVLALEIVNAAIAVGLSFLSPVVALIMLFFKLPMFIISALWIRALQARRHQERLGRRHVRHRREEEDNEEQREQKEPKEPKRL